MIKSKVTCPACNKTFTVKVPDRRKDTIWAKALLTLFRNCPKKLTTPEIARKVYGDKYTENEGITIWDTLRRQQDLGGYVDDTRTNRVGNTLLWRITESGINYLSAKGHISDNDKRVALAKLEKKRKIEGFTGTT